MSEDSPQAFGSTDAKIVPNLVLRERPPVIPREERAKSQLDKLAGKGIIKSNKAANTKRKLERMVNGL